MLPDTRWTILRAARSGDATALSDLCHRYRPAVVAYLERRGLDGGGRCLTAAGNNPAEGSSAVS